MYDEGRGVARDDAKARAWFQKAAEQGDVKAQLKLGLMYAGGEGGQKDYVQVYKWSALSVEHGMMAAGILRDTLASTMTPEQLAEAKRLVSEWKRKAGTGQEGATKN